MEGVGMTANGYWRDRRVFVTGATGFLGSWVAQELVEQGAHVVCLIRDIAPDSYLTLSGTTPRVAQVSGELEDYATLVRIVNEHEIDTCFHLAAQPLVTIALRHPLSTFESNIRGTWNLLEAVRVVAPTCAVVVASSDKVYGDAHALPYVEEFPLKGTGPYDVSKVCVDLLAQSYASTYGLRVAISRCGNFYGPGDLNWSRIVPGTIRALIEGRRPVIRSDGTLVRDYLYVGDAARAYLDLAVHLGKGQLQTGEAFNFGTERPTPVLAVVEQLTAIAGRPDLHPDIRNEAHHEIRSQYLSTDKSRRMLNWTSRVDLTEGLTTTYRWYESLLRNRSAQV
jgi:CDP-glucose 4,6-dehydratase